MLCSHSGCASKARTKGLCHKHYNAQWRETHVDQIRAYQRARYSQDEVRNLNLRHIYGLSLEQFNAMSAQQNGLCAICRRPPRDKKQRLCVDHDHVTGKVRGLLCLHCNVLLGKAEDSETILQAAIDYIRRATDVNSIA
jgi:hypothetical protein